MASPTSAAGIIITMLIKLQDIERDPKGWQRSCKLRGIADQLDHILGLNEQRRTLQKEYDVVAYRRRSLDYKTNQDAHKELSAEIKMLTEQRGKVESELEAVLSGMPNWVSVQTPPGDSDADNVEVERHGSCSTKEFCHQDAIGYCRDDAIAISGARMSIFRGDLARLELVLAQWLLDTHIAAGFEYVSVPSIVSADAMYHAGKLPKFAADAFSMEEGRRWLVPTSEIPLVCLARSGLAKLVACTPCYRREAGTAGRDTQGWVRQHQFTKVELVVACEEEAVGGAFEEICGRVKYVLDKLELTWRRVEICGGDMGAGAYRQVDFEVWLAGQGRWLEVSSVSDCRTYQSARLGIKDSRGCLAHTLNGTGGVPGRLMAAVLEQHYKDGEVLLPRVLADRFGKPGFAVKKQC